MRKGLLLYLIVCFLTGPLWPIFAQNPSEPLNSIERRLQHIMIYSQKLEDELKDSQRISSKQQQTISELLNELAGLRSELTEQSQELESSNVSLESYKLRVNELLSIINELEKRLQKLSESFENTVRPLQQALKVAEKEIRIRKIRSMIMTVAAFLAGAGLGYGLKAIISGR